MSKKKQEFQPDWFKGKIPSNSYRSIFKWGDPNFIKAPKPTLYSTIKEVFHMTDDDFKSYHSGILDAIQKSGAAMSHHHGIGKMFGPWLEGQMGKLEYSTFKTLKNHFDPKNIMNPGGTLGLDTKEDEKHDTKGVL